MRLALVLLACAVPLVWGAETGGVAGPVSGYVVDGRVHSLRPINGIPGAARLGDPVELHFAVGVAAIATGQDYGLMTAANGDGRPVIARGLRSGAPQVSSIDGAIRATGILLADSGAAAALYSDSELQFLDGLPAAASASAAVDVSALNGVAAAAIDASGRKVLLVARDGSVYLAARGADLKWLARIPGAVSASFLPSGDDAVVASADSGDVDLLRGLSGSLTIRTAAGAANGLTSARSVRALNASEAAVVDGDGRLGVITLDTGSIEWIGLAGAAERIDALDRGLLVLNGTGRGPLLLLDVHQSHAPYFVPPDFRGEGHHRK